MSSYTYTLRNVLQYSPIVMIVLMLNTSILQAEQNLGTGLPYQIVADYIHSIIEADRTLYTTHVVDRLQETGTALASERWQNQNTLPLPAQMLLLSGERVKKTGSGLHYRLASLWPIYKKNGPANDFERNALEVVQTSPHKPYTGVFTQNGQTSYFAVYADLAVSKSCVNCHNTHLLSQKRDHALGDVMGAIIISFPVAQSPKTGKIRPE